MKIGILGSGMVGSSFGQALTAKGHDVLFGVRNPQGEKAQAVVAACGPLAQAGSLQAAVDFGPLVAVTIPWDGLPEVMASVEGWAGKVVIDLTNRFGPLDAGNPGGSSRDLAMMLPHAAVVKAFNTVGAEIYRNPVFGAQRALIPVCGDDPAAKQQVLALAGELGFEAIDLGGLGMAAVMQAQYWVTIDRARGRDFAFGLLTR